MMRIWLIVLLGVLLMPGTSAHTAERRPNIVFIFADDWGWGDLSCHGHKNYRTPNIDRLAAQGIDFQQFNVCNPVCSPSRTAAMTGHFPSRYGVYQHFADHALNRQRGMPDWLDPKAPMISRVLQQAGYRTGHFGKWHLTHETIADAPNTRVYGFDESAVSNGPPPHTTPQRLVDEAIKFIHKNRTQPFYVNAWLHETHVPHYPSQASLDAQAGLDEQHRVYAAVIADGDRKVGRILETLRELDLDDTTLVVFSSDNGPEWTGSAEKSKTIRDGLGTYYSVGDTGGRRGRKRSLFEGGVRVPFIVPGHTPSGVKDDSTVIAAVDLFPTFCAAAGVPLPNGYQPDGMNMLAALEGRPVARTRPLFWEWRGPNPEPDHWPRLAVREGEWKLVLAPNEKRMELYNLVKDPRERKNRAVEEPDRVARMQKMAMEWHGSLPATPPDDCISKQESPPLIKKSDGSRGTR